MGPAAIRGARAPARPLTAGLRTLRRLPIPRPARGVEWLREPITLQQFVARQSVGRRAVRGAPLLCQYLQICTSTESWIRSTERCLTR